jgi:hypothetical protein
MTYCLWRLKTLATQVVGKLGPNFLDKKKKPHFQSYFYLIVSKKYRRNLNKLIYYLKIVFNLSKNWKIILNKKILKPSISCFRKIDDKKISQWLFFIKWNMLTRRLVFLLQEYGQSLLLYFPITSSIFFQTHKLKLNKIKFEIEMSNPKKTRIKN